MSNLPPLGPADLLVDCAQGFVHGWTEGRVRDYGRACAAAEREAWESALNQAWQMIDPLRPAGDPGSYARGSYQGIVDALTTVRANAAAV